MSNELNFTIYYGRIEKIENNNWMKLQMINDIEQLLSTMKLKLNSKTSDWNNIFNDLSSLYLYLNEESNVIRQFNLDISYYVVLPYFIRINQSPINSSSNYLLDKLHLLIELSKRNDIQTNEDFYKIFDIIEIIERIKDELDSENGINKELLSLKISDLLQKLWNPIIKVNKSLILTCAFIFLSVGLNEATSFPLGLLFPFYSIRQKLLQLYKEYKISNSLPYKLIFSVVWTFAVTNIIVILINLTSLFHGSGYICILIGIIVLLNYFNLKLLSPYISSYMKSIYNFCNIIESNFMLILENSDVDRMNYVNDITDNSSVDCNSNEFKNANLYSYEPLHDVGLRKRK